MKLFELLFGKKKLLSPVPEKKVGGEAVVQKKQDNTIELARKIRSGLREQLGKETPVEQYIPQLVEATRQYEFFRKNPYLLPQLAILETSGGQNITRPNNLLNWGIANPANNPIFAQMTPEEVLARAISGLGERSPYYKDVRHTGNLRKFAQIYEPANPDYYQNLISGIRVFEQQ